METHTIELTSKEFAYMQKLLKKHGWHVYDVSEYKDENNDAKDLADSLCLKFGFYKVLGEINITLKELMDVARQAETAS